MKQVSKGFPLWVGICVLCLGQFAWAGDQVTVRLKNGDRLSGEVLSQDETSLRLKSNMLGEISIPSDRIGGVDVAKNSDEKQVAEASGPKASGKPPEEVVEEATEEAEAMPVGRLRELVKSVSFPEWKKRLETGMTTQSGRRDKTDFSMRYTMNRKAGKKQHRFESKYYYGETTTFSSKGVPNIQKSTDKLSTSYRFRRDIAPGVFYESNSLYSWDAVKEIDLNLEQKFGLGYRFYNEKAFKLSTGAGASGRLRDDRQRDDEVEYLVDIFQDLDYRLSKRIRLTQDVRVAMPLEETNDYELRFSTGLTSDITESINMSMRYELEYDKSLSKDRREDQRFISSLGYNF